jgi:hypothetical protein
MKHDQLLSGRQSNPEPHLAVSESSGILHFGIVGLSLLSRAKLLPAIPLFVKVQVFSIRTLNSSYPSDTPYFS